MEIRMAGFSRFTPVATFAAVPREVDVLENGWSSFSPSDFYRADQTSPRSTINRWQMSRASSDRIEGLDEWGMRRTRELLVNSTIDPLVPAVPAEAVSRPW